MRSLIFIVILNLVRLAAFSQVTIDATDMPAPADTLRISVTNQVGIDFTKTGNDTIWDFSSLVPVSQRVESFVSPASVPAVYWIVFTPYTVTNLASAGSQTFAIPGLVITDPYTFFNNSTSSFRDLGFAMKIMDIPVTARYVNPDICYPFPLTVATSPWSSVSEYNAIIPGMGAFSTSRIRSSSVDGWGTVITPYGSFQAIRVKSHRIEHDSLYMDALGIGIPVDRDITEYKWLARGIGIPVLQVNTEGALTAVTYRDSCRISANPLTISLGPDTTICIGHNAVLTATVTGGIPPYRYLWSNLDTTRTIVARVDSTTTFTATVLDALNNASFDTKVVNTKICEGIYKGISSSFAVIPNPGSGLFVLKLPSGPDNYQLQVINAAGLFVTEKNITANAKEEFVADLTGIAPGLYFLKVVKGSSVFVGKLIITSP